MPRRIKIWGDLHLFDPLGRAREADTATIAECTGTACIANTAAPKGALPAHRLKLYGGTQLQGVFKTLKHSMALLELHGVSRRRTWQPTWMSNFQQYYLFIVFYCLDLKHACLEKFLTFNICCLTTCHAPGHEPRIFNTASH